ncbi:MAG: type II toxin-antitoxin system VapC family toxin, partial [Mesorhizobium sp.]
MKVSLDTNVLLWLIVGDDEAQQQTAAETLERAELVAISVQALCEFVWVLD